MSARQNDKATKQTSPRKIALAGAVATALALFNMMTNGAEAPSQTVMILQYGLLAVGLIGLTGGLIMTASQK